MTFAPGSGSVNLLHLSPAEAARVWAMIEHLSPADHELLRRVGEPRWVGAALPWRPTGGDEGMFVHRLCALGVVTSVSDADPPAFCLTPFGEQVVRVLHQWRQFGGHAQ